MSCSVPSWIESLRISLTHRFSLVALVSSCDADANVSSWLLSCVFTHCRQEWTKSAHIWPIPGSTHSHDVLQCNFSATTHLTFPLTFPPLKNVKPHNSAPEEAGGTRQDLMTPQRKLANNGDWASLWEESEMLLLSLGHGFIAQYAKLPMPCQKQTHIAQQELSWLTLLVPLLLW